jgi:acyl carrier protein
VGAFGLDFERWFAAHPAFADDPLFEGFTTAAAAGRPAILEELAASPGAARPPALAAWLRTQVGEVLRLPPGRVPGDAALTALGLDSMMAVELRERVRRALGVHLPLLDFFGGATVESLVGGLLDRIGPSGDDGEREEVIL